MHIEIKHSIACVLGYGTQYMGNRKPHNSFSFGKEYLIESLIPFQENENTGHCNHKCLIQPHGPHLQRNMVFIYRSRTRLDMHGPS